VKQYTFGASGKKATFTYTIPDFNQEKLDSSMVLVYVKIYNVWYSAPGRLDIDYSLLRDDSVVNNQLRISLMTGIIVYNTTAERNSLFLKDTSFDAVKVIIAPVSSITPLSLQRFDLSNYNSVKAYYHLGA